MRKAASPHAFCLMQDTADQYLRDRRLDPVLQAVIGGKFAQQIICKGVPYQSEKEEEFYQVNQLWQLSLHGTQCAAIQLMVTAWNNSAREPHLPYCKAHRVEY